MKHLKLYEVFLNETSYTDFLTRRGKEIHDAINKLALISSAMKHTRGDEKPLEIDDETYNKIEDKLKVYDTNVLSKIDHWIALGGRTEAHDIANFAIENMNRWGTEPQMVLYAIDDYFDVVDNKYNISPEEED